MFEMVGVDVFLDWLLHLCVNTLIQWISCVKVLSIFLFRLNVRHVGRMNTQVWLLNSLVGLAGWVNSELVGSMCHTERKMFNSVQNGEIPPEMSYLVFISSPYQNPRRMAECCLPESQESCLEITVLARIAQSRNHRMFGNKNGFSCQSNLPFCFDKIQPKPYRGLPQASHGTRFKWCLILYR